MAHPFAGHKQNAVGHRRVKVVMKSGGYAHSDAAADKKLFSKLINQHEKQEAAHGGEKRGGRADKYARGGRTKRAEGGILEGKKPVPMPTTSPPDTGDRMDATSQTKPDILKGKRPMARGGRTKHSKPHVNVNIIHASRSAPSPLPAGAAGLGAGAPLPPVAGPGPLPLPPGGAPPMKRGGRAKHKAEGGDIKPLEPSAPGSIERLGVNTYRRELGRQPTGKFGVNPYKGYPYAAKAKGGFVSGISSKGNIEEWKDYARKNTKITRADGGRIGKMRTGKKAGEGSGSGRLEEAKHMKGRYP